MKSPDSKQLTRKERYQADYTASKVGGESFYPYTVAKDAVVALILVALLFALAIMFPAGTEGPADPTSTTYNPRPEWYFLFFFQFLKLFPGSLEALAAVVIPIVALTILILLPLLDRGVDRRWSARGRIVTLGGVLVLFLGGLEVLGAFSAPARPAGEANPLVQQGQAVYRDVNCSYCHSINGVGGAVGPDLSDVGSQFKPDALVSYLRNPNAMIPNTLHPKLQFTDQELQGLVAYLETLGAAVQYTAQAPVLFKANCATCHMVNGQGGSVGPDLSTVGSRRPLSFLEAFTADPRSVIAGTSMPGFKGTLSQEQITDIAAYLFSLKTAGAAPSSSAAPPASPVPAPATPGPSPSAAPAPARSASQLYGAYCVSCHGANRQGGSSGPALTPAQLSRLSAARVATVISRGTNFMPAFSGQMSADEIDALAVYLKTPLLAP